MDASNILVSEHVLIVDIPSLSLTELVGNVSTKCDDLSLCIERASKDSSSPWKTAQFDEWLCLLKGEIKLVTSNGDIDVKVDQTAFIRRGTVFKLTFPVDSEFLALCKPAFKPERVIENVDFFHHTSEPSIGLTCSVVAPSREMSSDILYHMTTVPLWAAAITSCSAYYPPTFEKDGYYTHATAVPSRLVTTANHFYQDIEDEWICIELSRSALLKCGIIVKDEQPLPVGDKAVSEEWSTWVCPHIYGGIPMSAVVNQYRMLRDGKVFVGIEGL